MREEQAGSLCPGPSPFSYRLEDRTCGATHCLYQEGGIGRREGAQISFRLGSSWGRTTSPQAQAHLRPSQPRLPPGSSLATACSAFWARTLLPSLPGIKHWSLELPTPQMGCGSDGTGMPAGWKSCLGQKPCLHPANPPQSPTPNKGSMSNQAENFKCLCLLLKIYQLRSSSLEFLQGLESL